MWKTRVHGVCRFFTPLWVGIKCLTSRAYSHSCSSTRIVQKAIANPHNTSRYFNGSILWPTVLLLMSLRGPFGTHPTRLSVSSDLLSWIINMTTFPAFKNPRPVIALTGHVNIEQILHHCIWAVVRRRVITPWWIPCSVIWGLRPSSVWTGHISSCPEVMKSSMFSAMNPIQ